MKTVVFPITTLKIVPISIRLDCAFRISWQWSHEFEQDSQKAIETIQKAIDDAEKGMQVASRKGDELEAIELARTIYLLNSMMKMIR